MPNGGRGFLFPQVRGHYIKAAERTEMVDATLAGSADRAAEILDHNTNPPPPPKFPQHL